MTTEARPFRKILVCATEDWFVLSHFRPLLRAFHRLADDVVVATRDNGRLAEIATLGATVRPFDFARKATAPGTILTTARRLSTLIAAERPDAVHLIALKPIVLGALALRRHPAVRVGIHLTGLGHLAVTQRPAGRVMRAGSLALMRSLLRRDNAWLFVENEDDLRFAGATALDHATVLGGAGIDPDHFAPLPQRDGPASVAFVGRMIRSKGVDVLVEAARLLRASGSPVHVKLYGGIDTDNPEAYSRDEIEQWQRDGLASHAGRIDDVRMVWRDADVAVVPSRGGEGLPRSVLEAAACSRAMIVTDVPGCRRFVRDGIDGLVVPPDDAPALAAALARLMGSTSLRTTLGKAARRRVLDGFTEVDIEVALDGAYRRLASHVG